MALDSKNNIKSVFIVPALTAVTSGTITPGSTNGGVAGSVVITNVSNQVLVAGSGAGTGVQNYDKIKIIKDRGANLPLQQVTLSLSDIIAWSGTPGVAAVEQVSYLGYDGVSGTMDTTQNNFFIIKLEHLPNSFIYGKRPASYKYGTYQSDGSANQLKVATGLVKSLVQNFKPNRNIDWRVFTELTNAGTRTALTAGAGTITFTKYSKVVTASALTATTNAVVGDYVSIATGTTNGVYKITAIDGVTGNLTLDIAYQGATVTVTGAANLLIAAATANAAAFGIKITGIKQKYDVNRWRQYNKVRFNVLLENFSSGINVATTAAKDGTGVYEQVANDEYISWGDEGQIFVDQIPPQFREQDAVVGQQYQPVILGWLDKLNSLIGAGENKGQAILYMADADATLSDQALVLVQVLNSWLTGKFAALQNPLV